MIFPETFEARPTKDDILHGRQMDCFNCPLTRAIERATGLKAASSHDHISLRKEGIYRDMARYRTPRAASKFMTDFDAGDPVSPETFTFRRIS